MAELLAQSAAAGRQRWYLECRRPDATLMKELHHRLMGPPTQIVEVSGGPSQAIHIVHQQIDGSVTGAELEVVWPLHKSHYLSSTLQETEMPEDVSVDPTPVSAAGRDLAARALLAAACTQQRVSDLLEVSRRSVGRAAETDLAAMLQEATVVADARTILTETVRQGSSAEERDAAERWLAEALREPVSPRPPARPSTKAATTRPRRRTNGHHGTPGVTRPVLPSLPIAQISSCRAAD
jgi:hypothetical protein